MDAKEATEKVLKLKSMGSYNSAAYVADITSVIQQAVDVAVKKRTEGMKIRFVAVYVDPLRKRVAELEVALKRYMGKFGNCGDTYRQAAEALKGGTA